MLKPVRQLLDGDEDSVLALYGAALVAPYEARLRDFVCALVDELDAELTRRRTLDFTGLLVATRALLRDQLDFRRAVQRRLGALLVDEFQDTNKLQYKWIRMLAGTNGCVFAVGDDDQSIYRFRGADVGNMNEFLRDFEQYRMIVFSLLLIVMMIVRPQGLLPAEVFAKWRKSA